jgi:serine-type D-Ala-D-Ala carboxypeptidase/endopeptidase (penicillin-binding protein 4)
VTTGQLSQLLHSVARGDSELWPLYLGSLAVSGEKGSLAKRMKGTPAEGRVFAKTGWINGTSALSGYVKTAEGELLCFALLVDYPVLGGLNTSCWKPMGDQICAELANWKSKRPRVK